MWINVNRSPVYFKEIFNLGANADHIRFFGVKPFPFDMKTRWYQRHLADRVVSRELDLEKLIIHTGSFNYTPRRSSIISGMTSYLKEFC